MNPVHTAYRDATAGARLRYDEQLSRWNDHLTDLSAVERVHAARAGRVAAGWVGVAGALVLPVFGLIDLAFGRVGQGDLLAVLIAIWPAAGFALWQGRRAARRSLRLAACAPAPTGDPFTDLARLGADRPAHRLHALAEGQELPSVSLPLVALSVLLPLSIHTLVYLGFAVVAGRPEALPAFDYWIGLSMIVVGHAHIVLAICARRFARRLVLLPDDALMAEADRSWSSAFWWTVFASAVPGALLYLIPPILTAVTGALFCRAMYRGIASAVLRERALLEG